jgi:hypothetical protein
VVSPLRSGKKGFSCRESGDKTSGNIGEQASYSEHHPEITETAKRHCIEAKKQTSLLKVLLLAIERYIKSYIDID